MRTPKVRPCAEPPADGVDLAGSHRTVPDEVRSARRPIVIGAGLLATLAALWFVDRAEAEVVSIEASPIALQPSDPSRRVVGALEYLAGFELRAESKDWGRLSGATLDRSGEFLWAVSDRGMWLRLRLRHDEHWRLAGVDGEAELSPLLDRGGLPLDDPAERDAEALAMVPEGGYLVAFQGDDRLWRYAGTSAPIGASAKPVTGPRGLRRAEDDKGISALTVLNDGQLMALSEGDFNRTGDVRGWVQRDGRWSEVGWLPVGDYRPSDMATLPSGNLLLLTRRYSTYDGYSARLSIIDASEIIPLARLKDREIARLAAPLTVDNFEAIAARQGPDGSAILYLLSDDRGSALQRTLLLQFRVDAKALEQ